MAATLRMARATGMGVRPAMVLKTEIYLAFIHLNSKIYFCILVVPAEIGRLPQKPREVVREPLAVLIREGRRTARPPAGATDLLLLVTDEEVHVNRRP